MKGLIHIYTGDGKGKTTAALGLGLRAYGRGFQVRLFQFLKGADTGELEVLTKLGPRFEVRRTPEVRKFVKKMDPSELAEAKTACQELWQAAVAAEPHSNRCLIILDEVMAALKADLLALAEVVDFLKNKPNGVEVVLTGRAAPPELLGLADYVSEIQARKHPYEQGITAREGIEY